MELSMLPWYTTRESVMAAPDVKASAHNAPTIDADIAAASRSVEHILHRFLYPWTGTRSFDFPSRRVNTGSSWKIWLDELQLISLTSVLNGDGSTIAAADFFLNPQSGPPYDNVEISLAAGSSFTAGDTWQRAVGITGLWGDTYDLRPAGTLVGAINGTQTSIACSNSALVGVGSLLTIGTERTQVTDKDYLTTGGTLHADLTAKAADGTFTVDTARPFKGEQIAIDGELMDVVLVAGASVTVKRAASGSTLATHSAGATVYAPRTLTVARGTTGTAAASALDGAALSRWEPDAGIRQLTEALAVAVAQQRTGGWTKGKAEALEHLTTQIRETYGRYRSAVV